MTTGVPEGKRLDIIVDADKEQLNATGSEN